SAVVSLSAAAALIADFRSAELLTLIVGGMGSFAVYRRFGYVYAGVAALLCAAAIPFQFSFSEPAERSVAVTILAVIVILARRQRLRHGDDFPGDDYGIIQA